MIGNVVAIAAVVWTPIYLKYFCPREGSLTVKPADVARDDSGSMPDPPLPQ